MISVVKIDEKNRQQMIDSIRHDVVRHSFAYNDLLFDFEHTEAYAAFENKNLEGYLLIYDATEFPSVVLECEPETATKLMEHAPQDGFIFHTKTSLLRIIEKRYPHAKSYVENWMQTRKEQAHFSKSENVRKLNTDRDDAAQLAELLSTRETSTETTAKKYLDWISKMPLYGVFINNKLVAYAGSFIQLPEVWIIGGVYTHPEHRNKGYATLATSAITEEALDNSQTAVLFVRSDNYPAIKVYEKIGYKKIGEKLWVDVGTGRKP
jgi:RimJ/RimL family protein N-acetyltransferase